MYYWLRRRIKARLKMTESREDRLKFLEQYVAQLKEHERVAESRMRSGAASPMNVYFAQYDRLEAEMWLVKARKK